MRGSLAPMVVSPWLVALTALAWAPSLPRGAGLLSPRLGALAMVDAEGRVTRSEAEAAIEKAEALAAEALSAREEANQLAEQAERQSRTAADESESAANKLEGANTFSLSLLTASTAAQKASLDAGALIAEAVEASERADQLDLESAEALELAEELIAQHYEDFPDSA